MDSGNEPLVKMVNIHKWFGRVYALRGVDFYVNHGEVVGLVGDNGAGKSTLIKILSGVYPPDMGEIFFEGRRVSFKSPKDAIRLGIETLYQDIALVPQMNIPRNFFLGREIEKQLGPIKLLDLKKMGCESLKCLEAIGLKIANPKVSVENLSGGQRQGVALARAMYFKRKLLILDEPTNNLSVKETMKVLEYVRRLKEEGIASIFVTHNIHHVYAIADRIVILSHGKKVGDYLKDEISVDEIIQIIVSS
jgi:simple sugar transport system ATP-binding protein